METLTKWSKVDTYLPVFPGFYGSIFEAEEDSEIDHINQVREDKGLSKVDFDRFEFDYTEYNIKVCQDCCNWFESEMKDYVSMVVFEELMSPKEYNFKNDSINVMIHLSEENIENIKKFVFQNMSDFSQYIKDRYTSYDGFFSHYSNDPTDWVMSLDDTLEHRHQLGSILEFIILQDNDDAQYDMYDSVEAYLGVENYDQLTEMEYCQECSQWVDPEDFIGSACKECFEVGVNDYDYAVCACCKDKIENKWEERHFLHQLKHGIITPYQVVCSDCALNN